MFGSLKIKFLRKIADFEYTLLKLRTESEYRILGDVNDNSIVAITFNHTFGRHAWIYNLLIFKVDYINFKGDWYDYLELEFGIFGFWFSIWIRLWRKKKRYE